MGVGLVILLPWPRRPTKERYIVPPDSVEDILLRPLCLFILGELIERVQVFSWFEADCFSGSDGHFSTRPRITTDTGLAGFYSKDAETPQFNAVTFGKAFLHRLEDCIDCSFGFRADQSGSFHNALNQILFDQRRSLE